MSCRNSPLFIVQLLARYLKCNGGKLEEAEFFNVVFVVFEKSLALVCELLSNNSLFVGQLYEDKLLALYTHSSQLTS